MKKQETLEQIAFFDYLELHPALRMGTFHVPNGGSRHMREAVKLKRMGVTAGVPDVLCLSAAQGYHGLAIEFKSDTGVLTKPQKEWNRYLNENNYLAVVVRSFEEAKEVFMDYRISLPLRLLN
jgi:hypothetical protein